MARTHGHGNPKWTRDETILALDLFFKFDGHIPSGNHPAVISMSALLQSLPYHPRDSRKDSFRNPDGVAFKLQNLRHVATGKGLGKVSSMDRTVWKDLGARREETRRLAALIRAGVKLADELDGGAADESEDEFFEGRVLTQNHRRRERSRKLRKRVLEARRKTGPLECDLCRARPRSSDPDFEDATFEVHHLVPVFATQERRTRIADVALLCANCHRLIHRAISISKTWLTIEEGRSVLGTRTQ